VRAVEQVNASVAPLEHENFDGPARDVLRRQVGGRERVAALRIETRDATDRFAELGDSDFAPDVLADQRLQFVFGKHRRAGNAERLEDEPERWGRLQRGSRRRRDVNARRRLSWQRERRRLQLPQRRSCVGNDLRGCNR
jgi:hypothetical protein